MKLAFWQEKTLEQMTEEEWEALCDGCGKCCLQKLIDEETETLYYTSVGCHLLDCQTCQCSNYTNRFKLNEECIKLSRENVYELDWLPSTCAYRLLLNQQPLPAWHPLLTGSKQAMHAAGQSVQGKVHYDIDIDEWEDFIISFDEE